MKTDQDIMPGFIRRRYHTVEDAEKRENSIPAYRKRGSLIEINPEYVDAPYEEVFYFRDDPEGKQLRR